MQLRRIQISVPPPSSQPKMAFKNIVTRHQGLGVGLFSGLGAAVFAVFLGFLFFSDIFMSNISN